MGSRIWRIGSMFLLALLVTGCFGYEERIVLKSDGSGKVNGHYFISRRRAIPFARYRFPTEPKAVHEFLEKEFSSDKVKLLEYIIRKKGNKTHVYFTLEFDDLRHLNELSHYRNQDFQLHYQGSEAVFKRTIPIEIQNWKKDKFVVDKPLRQLVKNQALSQIKFRLEVDTPGQILKTSTDVVVGQNRAIWYYRLSELMEMDTLSLSLRYSIK